MEQLDIYTEYMEHIGFKSRDEVHSKGLWHKTIHCWLYDKLGNIYFQIRAQEKKLYTSASGHVLKGETVKDAFSREVFEEIGVKVSTENATQVETVVWRMDAIKNNKPFIDRAFAHIYVNEIDENYSDFNFDPNEVDGIVKINASDCLNLLLNKTKKINGIKISNSGLEKIKLSIKDFLVNAHEIAIIKYGLVLQTVIELTKK